MEHYTKQELTESLREVTSTILKCEKSQEKFVEGTSQYSLLRNRIKALYISKLLIEAKLLKTEQSLSNQSGDGVQKLHYTKEEIKEALPPIISIISKCEKAQSKFEDGTSHHTRFKKIIKVMYLVKSLIENLLSNMI